MLAKALTEAEERKCLLLLRPDFSGGIEFASRAVSFEVAPGEALDLQLFAAEDEGRTEEPSERRKREERDKGNVPKSQDMAGSAILIGGVLMLFLFGTYMVQRIGEMFSRYFGLIATQQGVFGIEELQVLMKDLFYQTGMILLPILGITIVMGVVGNLVQVGLMFSLQAIQFRAD